MSRSLAVAFFGIPVLLLGPAFADENEDRQEAREALQSLNDFIGGWKGNGAPEKSSTDIWKESIRWSWRFKKNDAWLTLEVKGGKLIKSSELRYLVDKKAYQLTAKDNDDKTLVFLGKLKKNRLVLESVDKKTKETRQLVMNLAGGGVRFVYVYAHKPANRTLFTRDFQVGLTKEGESFGTKEKKVECVVSGGLGTIAVSFKGTTYYVCCSGCRDAFNEDPEKYIKEYEAKKKMK
jgi:YHS domain